MNDSNRTKILIADDEEHIRSLVTKLLGNNHVILEARNGEEAIDITLTFKPALILLDILMPKVDGYTACSMIKANKETGGIPIIMLTAVDHELNRKYAKEIGADGYLLKPFTLKELRNIIDQFLKPGQ